MRSASHALALVLVAAALFACPGPAAGEAVFTDGTSSASDDPKKDEKSSSTSSTSTTGGAAADAFFGIVKYDAAKAPTETADGHAGTHTGKTPLAGKECATAECHAGTVQPWSMSGTVYDKKTGGAGIAKVQVGVQNADKTVAETYTDAQGNFWIELPAPPPAGSKVAVRKAAGSASQPMVTPLPAAPAGGNCNSAGCHGEANRVFVD